MACTKTCVTQQRCGNFVWRAPLGAWRCLILGSIGVASYACGGRADSPDPDGTDQDADRDNPGDVSNAGSGGDVIGGVEGPNEGPFANGGATATEGPNNAAPAFAWACTDDESSAYAGSTRRCTNGMLHRVSPEACRSDTTDLASTGGCLTDSDCNAGQLCTCRDGYGYCVRASCSTDADCGEGLLCAGTTNCSACDFATPRCSELRFACQSRDDTCIVDGDCSSGTLCEIGISPNPHQPVPVATDYRRSCTYDVGCLVPGRPFLVAGAARLAECVERSDWSSPIPSAAESPLRPEQNAAIASGWVEQALMEHASVAAFARFALQLLSLGAPAELVAGAAAAMQDELRHARDCFGLARRYSSRDVGPGPLLVEGALEETELAAIVATTVREGCIGETLAALEAAEALEHCEDAEARAVLERIATEETRHAQLAWKFVAWALVTGPRELRAQVREVFDAVLGDAALGAVVSAPAAIGASDLELSRHGLLSPALRQALRPRVLREVVAPCASALLASPADLGRESRGVATFSSVTSPV